MSSFGSMASSSDASTVSVPRTRAAIWSIDVPARMSGPSVFFGWTPVRNVAAARTWSPVPLAGQRERRGVGEAAYDEQPVLERGERLQRHRQIAQGSLDGRCPLVHDHAVGHVAGEQPGRGPRRGAADGGERRHHAVEQRQRQRRADAAQERPAGQRCLRDDHGSAALLIWNGVLRTMPSMSADQRYPSRAATSTIARTAGASNDSTPRPSA